MASHKKTKKEIPIPIERDDTLKMCKMLPLAGFKYKFIPDQGRRIVSAKTANSIMWAFHRTIVVPARDTSQASTAATGAGVIEKPLSFKKMFDQELTKLIDAGTQQIHAYCDSNNTEYQGQIPYNHEFWFEPKAGTMFANIDDYKVYSFVLKHMEGREAWKASMTPEQLETRVAYPGTAAHALDQDMDKIDIARHGRPQIAGKLGEFMVGSMADQTIADGTNPFDSDSESDEELRDGERPLTIEDKDAYNLYIDENGGVFQMAVGTLDIDSFLDDSIAAGFKARRAPVWASLLDGTRIPISDYEVQLQKDLCTRAWKAGTMDLDLHRENCTKAWAALEEQTGEANMALADKTSRLSLAEHKNHQIDGSKNTDIQDADMDKKLDADNMDIDMEE